MKCSAFWNHTNVRAGNRVYACCRFRHPIQNFDGDLVNILQSKEYESLRIKSAAGEFIPGCEKCAYEESIGHKSLRQEFNEQYNFDNVELKFLEIGFDNLCNLVCDGCNSEFSTSWIIKEKQIFGAARNKLLEIDEIVDVPNSIKKVLFLGGEPLITDKHYKLIKEFKEPKEIVYNTNATFIPPEYIIQEMRKHNTKFIISIDGFGDLNEKVRGGTKWQNVLDFIEWVENNNFNFEFNTVLHKNNYFGIFELSEFLEKYNKNWYVNCLTYPSNLDIKTLTLKELDVFKENLKDSNIPTKDFILGHISA